MSDLRDLYQEVILDHSRRPRNFRELPEANRRAEGYNPLCGDRATVYVRLDGDIVTDVAFKRDAQGNVTGFEAGNGRARGIVFKKVNP